MKWPWMLRSRHEVEMTSVRASAQIEKGYMRSEMQHKLRAAVDELPSARKNFDEFLDVSAQADVETERLSDVVCLRVRIKIDRKLARTVDSDVMCALVASDAATAVRDAIEKKRTVDIPVILAEALGCDAAKRW